MSWIDHHCTLRSCFYFFCIFHFSFILRSFSCRDHLSQTQMFIFTQTGGCVSSLKWCSSVSLCKQMCCDWKTFFNNWVKFDYSIWNLFELLKQHWRLWCFLRKYNCLDFAKLCPEIWAKFSAKCTMSKVFVMLKWGESRLRLLIYHSIRFINHEKYSSFTDFPHWLSWF